MTIAIPSQTGIAKEEVHPPQPWLGVGFAMKVERAMDVKLPYSESATLGFEKGSQRSREVLYSLRPQVGMAPNPLDSSTTV